MCSNCNRSVSTVWPLHDLKVTLTNHASVASATDRFVARPRTQLMGSTAERHNAWDVSEGLPHQWASCDLAQSAATRVALVLGATTAA
jgi:hypothetical protein